MPYYDRTHSHLYSVYFAPRGRARMYDLGVQIAQLHLSPFDRIIGVLGEAGSGKSMLIKGMFPGLELTNDDDGVNVRPLPLLGQDDETGFYSPHTYHVDIRFELGFTQPHVIAEAVMQACARGKRVVIEHFDMLAPVLGRNADLLIGLGEEIIVTRPTIFGPQPQEICDIVYKSMRFRQMAHTAEDLCECYIPARELLRCRHDDIKRGFVLAFEGEEPHVDLDYIEERVKQDIAAARPICYVDEGHIMIGDKMHPCTGPRTHVAHTGCIEGFRLVKKLIHDVPNDRYLLAGRVGKLSPDEVEQINNMVLE